MKARNTLRKIGKSQRHAFVGTFNREGFKSFRDKYNNRTILSPTLILKNIRMVDDNPDLIDVDKNSRFITQHLWLNYGKQIAALGKLKGGDKIFFKARVSKYKKFFNNRKHTDYQLERPTQIKKINNHYGGDLPLDNKNALLGFIMLKHKNLYFKNNEKAENFYTKEYNKWLANHSHFKTSYSQIDLL